MIRGLTGFMAASAKRSLRDILFPASPDTRFHRRRKLAKWPIPEISQPLQTPASRPGSCR